MGEGLEHVRFEYGIQIRIISAEETINGKCLETLSLNCWLNCLEDIGRARIPGHCDRGLVPNSYSRHSVHSSKNCNHGLHSIVAAWTKGCCCWRRIKTNVPGWGVCTRDWQAILAVGCTRKRPSIHYVYFYIYIFMF